MNQEIKKTLKLKRLPTVLLLRKAVIQIVTSQVSLNKP